MFIRTRDSHPRSVAKALSWRIAGSLDTFVLSLIFTRSLQLAGSIAVTEMFTKMVLYYFHERRLLGCNSLASAELEGFVLYFFLRWNLASTASVPLDAGGFDFSP